MCMSTVGYFLGFYCLVVGISLQGEKHRREQQIVKDIAEFLLLSQIPGFVSFCLSNAMHSIGQSIKSPLCPSVHPTSLKLSSFHLCLLYTSDAADE